MPLSWNEIRHRAIAFSKEWSGAKSEQAEKQTFWNEFFNVFGIRRRTVASFEDPAKNISGDYGYIDLFWPGILLVEHKSLGKDLGKAESQAFRYIQDLARAGRTNEIPRYVIVSDFARIALHDLEPEDQRHLPLLDTSRVHTTEFPLADFHKYIHTFAFVPGYKQHKFEEQDPINIEAVGIMGRLHDALEAGGYSGHKLERFLVRILFCLFAEDTGIFERESFHLYLVNRTAEDGSDLGLHLARLFEVLNTPEEERQKNLDETLASFRYVNGDLFAEQTVLGGLYLFDKRWSVKEKLHQRGCRFINEGTRLTNNFYHNRIPFCSNPLMELAYSVPESLRAHARIIQANAAGNIPLLVSDDTLAKNRRPDHLFASS
jgi:hypothetical protein